MPISWDSGSEPNIFMPGADNQDVGGEGGLSAESKLGGGDGMFQEKGEAGGEELGLSFSVIVAVVRGTSACEAGAERMDLGWTAWRRVADGGRS